MEKCDFCNKIYSYREAMEWKNDDVWYLEEIDYVIIVKDDYDDNSDFELWNRCNDPYFTGKVMDINYCPKCGRKMAGVGSSSK